MEVLYDVLPLILYILGAGLLLVLILIGVRTLNILKRAEAVMDMVEDRAASLNETFKILNKVNQKLALVSDKMFDVFWGWISNTMLNRMGNKKKKRKEEEDDE